MEALAIEDSKVPKRTGIGASVSSRGPFAALWRLDLRWRSHGCPGQVGHPHQVKGGHLQLCPHLVTGNTYVSELPTTTHSLAPAEYLLHPLPYALANGVARMPCCPAINRRVLLLGYARRHATPLASLHEVGGGTHTDCGYERFAGPELQPALSNRLTVDKAEVVARANPDDEASIRVYIEKLRRSTLVPNDLRVSGHIYDI